MSFFLPLAHALVARKDLPIPAWLFAWGASIVLIISFFALSGFIFLVTQYFQFIKGYGPLSTGVRLLPVATCVAAASILGARLAVRIGTKLVVAAGLLAMAGFYLWVTLPHRVAKTVVVTSWRRTACRSPRRSASPCRRRR